MITEILLSLLLGLVIIFYFHFTRNNDYWKQRGVPFEKPVFLFGNYKDSLLGRKHVGIIQADLYNKFKNARYVGYFRLNDPVIILRDPELIKDVLVKDFHSFSNNEFQVDPITDPIWATNPFSKVGEAWKTARGQWSASLTPSKVKAMYEVMWEKGDVMVAHVEQCIKDNPSQQWEAREMASNFFTDVIVSAVFGLQVNSWLATDNQFIKIARSIFRATFWDGMINLTFVVAPWMSKLFSLRFVPKSIQVRLIAIAEEIISCQNETSLLKNDVYEIMKKYSELDSKHAISVTELAGRVFGFLADGTETSSGVLGLMLFELAAHPDIQNKLRAELDAAAPKGEMIPFDDLTRLPYLDMVFSEITRLYSPGLSVNRVCSKEYEFPAALPGGQPVRVPVGMTITIPTYALHKDPQYFPDPEKFDPERFAPDAKDKITKFTYMPFGEGPRMCIGMKLATAQTKVALAHIIRNFDVKFCPDGQKKPILPDPNVFIYRAIGKLLVILHKRTL